MVEMVEMASRFKDEHQKFMDSRPKGKAKKSFASWFSFSGTQGFECSRSSGKKRKDKSGGISGGRHSFTGKSNTGFSQAGSSGRTFYMCGQADQFAANCPRSQQAPGQLVCYNCGKPGHTQRFCPNPPKRAGDAPQQPTKGRVISISAPDAGPFGDVVKGKG